jgi:hypothetical protein
MDFMQVICSAVSSDTVDFALALCVIVEQGWHLLPK